MVTQEMMDTLNGNLLAALPGSGLPDDVIAVAKTVYTGPDAFGILSETLDAADIATRYGVDADKAAAIVDAASRMVLTYEGGSCPLLREGEGNLLLALSPFDADQIRRMDSAMGQTAVSLVTLLLDGVQALGAINDYAVAARNGGPFNNETLEASLRASTGRDEIADA